MQSNDSQGGSFLDPYAVIRQLNIHKGQCVADFGCGPGYFTIPFAKAVAESGKVYALDILPQALETVASDASRQGLLNIITSRVNLEKKGGSKLENESIDWVMLKDMLFQNNDKETIIEEVGRVLKNGGKCIVIEWGKASIGVGPQNGLRLSPDDARRMFEQRGFMFEKALDVGSFHYGLVVVK